MRLGSLLFCLLLLLLHAGCGQSKQAKPADSQARETGPGSEGRSSLPDSELEISENKSTKPASEQDPPTQVQDVPPELGRRLPKMQQPVVQVDAQRLNDEGIRKWESKHLTLWTDIRDDPALAELPQVFDAAVPQWARYFNVDGPDAEEWRMTAFVIADKERFIRAGILTSDLPPFATGFQQGSQIWIYPQPGGYYTRHLLLHEGTHGFMERFLGGYGASWYSEGMAEMLAVHRWADQSLALRHRLADRSEAENWGRVRIIQDAVAAGKLIPLDEALNVDAGAFYRAAVPYAWSWAACRFLSEHPLSREAFAELPDRARHDPAKFTRDLRQRLQKQWPQLQMEWQVFVNEMDYGVDVAAAAIQDVDSTANVVKIGADRGWQRTGITIKPGYRYVVRSWGRFQIADDGQPWISEADGVSIEYYRGKPLGQILAAVESVDESGRCGLLDARSATRKTLVFDYPGQLCFRVNDSPARWGDNKGEVQVEIKVLSPAK